MEISILNFYKRDKYYHILIGFRYITEGWINHRDMVEIIETDKKYLLILLGNKAGEEILKPEHALIVYMPLPQDSKEITYKPYYENGFNQQNNIQRYILYSYEK